MDQFDYLAAVLAAVLAQEIVDSIYDNSAKSDCETCCPKSPQLFIPDSADLIHFVLKGNGLNNLTPLPVQLLSNTVTIFKGPFAGHFGIIYQGRPSPCSCCVLVQITSGVVKVSTKHCNIHR